jgi:hypothetical protein
MADLQPTWAPTTEPRGVSDVSVRLSMASAPSAPQPIGLAVAEMLSLPE